MVCRRGGILKKCFKSISYDLNAPRYPRMSPGLSKKSTQTGAMPLRFRFRGDPAPLARGGALDGQGRLDRVGERAGMAIG